MTQKKYPAAYTSRTLETANRSFTTVVGKHDKRLTDADINLIQDLQDYKRSRATENMVFSGALQHKPFSFKPSQERVFFVPAFDVMFNGEVVTIGGNLSADLSINKIMLPAPSFWAYGQAADPASIYVVYLELWYRALNPEDIAGSSGYYIDSTQQRFIYANGCINCDSSNLIPDDVIDPFQDTNTTSRGQIQWAFRTQRVPVSYDFTKRRFGLDPIGDSTDVLFGRAFLSAAPETTSQFKFSNLGAVNGDFGLWRAGDGADIPAIPTLDGYSYAMPVAVVFQRNTGNFDPSQNPHGCAESMSVGSGVLMSGVSGRYDYRYADVVYSEDVVDTRLTVSMEGYDWDRVLKTGFVDLINGDMCQKIGRGESPGSDAIALGSEVPYTITVSPSEITNTDHIGSFDGFFNSFGADARTSYAVRTIGINQKTTGSAGVRWAKDDAFTIDLDASNTRGNALISYVLVQALVTQPDRTVKPALLLSGQVKVTGLGTRKVNVAFVREMLGTAFDPGVEDLYVTIGVSYPAGSDHSLKKVPHDLAGGILEDAAVSRTFNVFGVSEYATFRAIENQACKLIAYNPQYSNRVFGVRAELLASASDGVVTTPGGVTTTSFTFTRTGINNKFSGIYIVGAKNTVTGEEYTILSTAVDSGFLYVSLGTIPPTANLAFGVVLNQTAQLSYNAPVKAVTAINETVLFGNYNQDVSLPMDTRIKLKSQKREASSGITTLLFATGGATLSGIAGNPTNKYIFVADDPAHTAKFTAYPILEVQFFNGCTTVVVPAAARVDVYPYFMVGSLAPAFSTASKLYLTLHYIPYQGEGNDTHTYSILHSEEFALVTTNGTGAAPIVGLKDVYPYNREFPIVAALPGQPSWDDSELTNQAVSNYFDGNYEAKRFNNVEHTFMTPLHTNDFIEPVGGWKRKKVKLSFKTGRGFSKVTPHIGFAIRPPKPKENVGTSIISTSGPMAVYINNVTGNDTYDGSSVVTPKRTLYGALSALPPVLRHPCFIYLVNTNIAYNLRDLKSAMTKVYLGDGDVQSSTSYCLANIGHTIQDGGRLYIGKVLGELGYPEISAAGYVGFGDGPSSAFIVTDSRVVFSGLKFSSFVNPAVYAIDSYVDFIDCQWQDNFIAGSFIDGCSVTMTRGNLVMANSGTGFILEDSALTASNLKLGVSGGVVNSFFVCERTSNLTLQNHATTDETNLTAAATIVLAKLGSTIVCSKTFASAGSATVAMNSVLTRTPTVTPFAGGIVVDSSSVVMTDIS